MLGGHEVVLAAIPNLPILPASGQKRADRRRIDVHTRQGARTVGEAPVDLALRMAQEKIKVKPQGRLPRFCSQ
jgi:hypothetical protein